jgi:hypothetical protein
MVDPESDGHSSSGSHNGGGVCPGWAVVIRHGVIIAQEEWHDYDAHGEKGAGGVQTVDEGPGRVGEDNKECGDQDTAQHILQEGEKTMEANECFLAFGAK